jgi:hypothetical protein
MCWNGGSLGSFCHSLLLSVLASAADACRVLRALQEYGDDGIGHDDVKDFINDAYAHKTLLITVLITLCR